MNSIFSTSKSIFINFNPLKCQTSITVPLITYLQNSKNLNATVSWSRGCLFTNLWAIRTRNQFFLIFFNLWCIINLDYVIDIISWCDKALKIDNKKMFWANSLSSNWIWKISSKSRIQSHVLIVIELNYILIKYFNSKIIILLMTKICEWHQKYREKWHRERHFLYEKYMR
jgi:hypothetical protein